MSLYGERCQGAMDTGFTQTKGFSSHNIDDVVISIPPLCNRAMEGCFYTSVVAMLYVCYTKHLHILPHHIQILSFDLLPLLLADSSLFSILLPTYFTYPFSAHAQITSTFSLPLCLNCLTCTVPQMYSFSILSIYVMKMFNISKLQKLS